MWYLPYNKNLKEFSRQLRNNATKGEILLWLQLRAGSFIKYTFNRQKPLDHYIVDFYCSRLNLVIEVDGGYHKNRVQRVKDAERQQVLEGMGLHFLRFDDEAVRNNMPYVLSQIEQYILAYEKAHPAVVRGRKRKASDSRTV